MGLKVKGEEEISLEKWRAKSQETYEQPILPLNINTPL